MSDKIVEAVSAAGGSEQNVLDSRQTYHTIDFIHEIREFSL